MATKPIDYRKKFNELFDAFKNAIYKYVYTDEKYNDEYRKLDILSAIYWDLIEVVKWLIDEARSVQDRNDVNQIALFEAIKFNKTEIAKLLINDMLHYGGNFYIRHDPSRFSYVEYAQHKKRWKILSMLKDAMLKDAMLAKHYEPGSRTSSIKLKHPTLHNIFL